MLSDLVPPLPTNGAPQNAIPLSSGSRDSQLYDWLVGGQIGASGYAVSEHTAMSVGAVYAAVGLIAGAVQSIPLAIYKRIPDGKESVDIVSDSRAANLWWLLNEQPHRAWSASVFWEYMVASLLLCGDAFALVERNGSTPATIRPYHPNQVTVERSTIQGDAGLMYTFREHDGRIFSRTQDDVLHIPGLGFDGLRGLSPIKYAAKNAIGTALAAEDYSGRFFSNGARPDILITLTKGMTSEQVSLFRETWNARFGGAARSHMPAILTGDAKVENLTLNAEDTQIIATRRFQIEDIARIFGVPPHMIGSTDKATSWGTGIEHQSIAFVRYTLQRHLTKIEQELNRKLFPRSLRWFAEFKTEGLERGDLKSRYEAHRIALGRAGEPGWKTPNEIRKIENDAPLEGGDDLNTGIAPAPPVDETPEKTAEAMAGIAGALGVMASKDPAITINNDVSIPKQDAPVVNWHQDATQIKVEIPETKLPEFSPVVNVSPMMEVKATLEQRPTRVIHTRDENGELIQSVSEVL